GAGGRPLRRGLGRPVVGSGHRHGEDPGRRRGTRPGAGAPAGEVRPVHDRPARWPGGGRRPCSGQLVGAEPARSMKTTTLAVNPWRKFLPPTGPSSPAQKNPATGAPSREDETIRASWSGV